MAAIRENSETSAIKTQQGISGQPFAHVWFDPQSRRRFIKRSSVVTTGSMLAIHGVDFHAMAQTTNGDTSTAVPWEQMLQYQFKMICIYSPENHEGTGWRDDHTVTLVGGSLPGQNELRLRSSGTGPGLNKVTTAEMRAAGQFIFLSAETISAEASAELDFAFYNFLHPNDVSLSLSRTGVVAPVAATWSSSPFSTDTPTDQKPAPPDEYFKPAFSPSSEKGPQSTTANTLTLYSEYAEFGWTFVPTYAAPSTLTLSNANIGSWSPSGDAGKTETATWVWGFVIVSRKRDLRKKRDESNWTPIPAPNLPNGQPGNPNGWSPWL